MKKNVIIYYIMKAFTGLRFMVPIWVTFYLRRITFEQMAFAETINFLMTVIFELPSGALADMIGRKWAVIAGFILSGIGMIGITFSMSFNPILLFYIINGIGTACLSGSDIALIYDSLKQINREKSFSKVIANGAVIYRIAFIFSTATGALLFNIRESLPYMLVGVFLFLSAFIFLFAREPTIDSERFTLKGYIKNFKLGAREAFKNKFVSTLSLYYILIFSVGLILIYYYEQLFAVWIGFSESEIGCIFTFIAIGTMIISLFSKRIEKIFGVNRILIIMSLLPGLVLIFSFKIPWLGILILVIESWSIKIRHQYLTKYVNMLFNSKHRAAALSTLNMFVSLFYLIFIPLSGFIFNEKNVGPVMQILGGILLTFALPIAISIIKDEKNTKLIC